MAVRMGQNVVDRITGFKGKVTAITNYLYGCRRFLVEGIKDNAPVEYWFDEERLTGQKAEKPGGPREAAPSKDPSRK